MKLKQSQKDEGERIGLNELTNKPKRQAAWWLFYNI